MSSSDTAVKHNLGSNTHGFILYKWLCRITRI